MDVTALSASELSRRIAAGDLRPSEVMAAFLDRIDATNPALNAIVALRDRADLMAEARAADLAPRQGWLHGIPVAVKDLQAVSGVLSTSGSPIFARTVPTTDDPLPARLRAAGAIVIGKTNTPEFGLGSHSFNPVHGVTANPYDNGLSAGGSSGGAAAALAAHMVPVADGSDMMGSLRNPAAFCNVYGFRPTAGLLPRDPGDSDLSHLLATDGPMARTVEDLAALLETLAGTDGPEPQDGAFTHGLDRDVTGRKIGWLGDWGGAYGCEPGILGLCEDALATLSRIGCTVEPVAPPFPAAALWDSWTTLRSRAVATGLGAYYADPSQRELLKPEAVWEIERGLAMDEADLHRAQTIRQEWLACLDDLFTRYDALVLPSAQVWPFPKEWRYPKMINGRNMDTYHRWMEIVVPVSLAGLPALAVPAGFSATGLPMGVQIFGRTGNDRAILQLGQAYHRAIDWPGTRPPAINA